MAGLLFDDPEKLMVGAVHCIGSCFWQNASDVVTVSVPWSLQFPLELGGANVPTMDVKPLATTFVGLFCRPKMEGCAKPLSVTVAAALPVFWMFDVTVPIEPAPTVPKFHVVLSGVFPMTAPRACMTRFTTCGMSPAAS